MSITGDDVIPRTRPGTRSFDVFFDLRLNKGLSKLSEAGDLRRYRARYDVTVMIPVQRIAMYHPDDIYERQCMSCHVIEDENIPSSIA